MTRLRPTPLGWKALGFHIVLLAAYLAAPYANMFFLLVTLSTVIGSLGVWWTYRNLRGTTGGVDAWTPVGDHRAADFSGWVEVGRGRAWRRHRRSLSIVVELEAGSTLVMGTPTVTGRTPVTGRFPRLTRGVYPVRRATLQSTWPFGLFRASREVDAPDELVVYPAPGERGGAAGARGGGAGDHDAPLPVGGRVHPSGLRAFRSGDDPRAIHWRATARRNRPVLLEWDGGTGDGREVVLDRRGSATEIDERLRRVASLGLRAKEEKAVMTLRTQGATASYGLGQHPWASLWRALAVADVLPATAPPPPAAAADAVRLGGRS